MGKITKIVPEVEAKVIALYLEGRYTNFQIAEMTGISSTSVTHIAQRNKLPPKQMRYNFSDEQIAEIVRMYKDGMSQVKIAKAFGVKRHKTIYEILKKENVVFRAYVQKNDTKKDLLDKFVRGEQFDQLCWYCKNATGGCSWTNGTFTPVPGWDAKYIVRTCASATYSIKDCPLFEKG